MKKLIRIGLVTFALFAAASLMYSYVYFSTLKGDAFLSARAALMWKTDPRLGTGNILEVDLPYINSIGEKTYGSEGTAQFKVKLITATGSKNAIVVMRLKSTIWSLKRLNIDGRTIDLENAPALAGP